MAVPRYLNNAQRLAVSAELSLYHLDIPAEPVMFDGSYFRFIGPNEAKRLDDDMKKEPSILAKAFVAHYKIRKKIGLIK